MLPLNILQNRRKIDFGVRRGSSGDKNTGVLHEFLARRFLAGSRGRKFIWGVEFCGSRFDVEPQHSQVFYGLCAHRLCAHIFGSDTRVDASAPQ